MKYYLVLLFTFATWAGYAQNEGINADSLIASDTKNALGSFLPAFVAYTDSGTITNKNLQGKVVFVNVWVTGCMPCMAEMAALNDVYDSLKNYKNFVFASFTPNDRKTINKVKEKYGIPYTIASALQETCWNLNWNSGFPTSIIVNTAGKVVYFKLGGNIDSEKARVLIMKELYPKLLRELNENIK